MVDTVRKENESDAALAGEPPGSPLYPLALGAGWHKLDTTLQSFHGTTAPRRGEGAFDIRRGERVAARILAWLLCLPKEGCGVPTKVLIHCEPQRKPDGIVEIWDRTFDERRLISVQSISARNMLMERFGMIEVGFRLTADKGALCFASVCSALTAGRLRITLPQWLSPRVTARVARRPASGFAVSVNLVLPWIGSLLSYEGYLEVVETKQSHE
jgi:hypothetical protein